MAAPLPLTPIGSALAGALGAVFSNASVRPNIALQYDLAEVLTRVLRIVYPLDTVKTRLQTLPSSSVTPAQTSEEQSESYHNEHVRKPPRSLPRKFLRQIRRWQMLSLLLRILRTEGIAGAFKGFTANMINTFSMRGYILASCFDSLI